MSDPKEGLTAADIKKQIDLATKEEKAKVELKDSGVPLTGMVANEINATASTPKLKPIAESKPEPVKAAENKDTAQSVDYKEWATKKGIDWTTDQSVLAALHKSDQEFHKRQAEKKVKEPAASYTPPSQPTYPFPQNGYQPPYVPQSPNQREAVENLARQYNMLPEDVERLARFNRDLFDSLMSSERQKQDRELASIRIENQKNSVFRELSSDPVFRRPDVAMEYHKVLDEMQGQEPQSFEQDPNAYRRAFDKTLQNIARRNLEGRPLQEGVSPVPGTPPTTPPRPLGVSSGGGSMENENGIDAKMFAKLPLEEKRKLLEKAGLRPAY